MSHLTRLFRSITAAVVLAVLPAALAAQGAGRALVYCPIGLDETGCGNIVAALDAPGATFAGAVDRGYDGTGGTVDLATADLSIYRVVLVPSLSDGATGRPYDRLRNATVAARLRAVLTGRRAVWSGTPDLGTGSTAEKTTLIANLAAWAAGGSGAGLIALLDNSEDPATRYDWLAGIGALAVGADTTVASYDSVRALSTIASGVLTVGGTPLAYPNMAAFGVHAGTGASEDARGLNADGTAGSAVLVTAADGTATAPASPPASPPSGAKAMVYCPVAADGPACDNIVAALTAAGTPFTAVDRAYDGSSGTLDLRNADLGGYAVLVVPSLADGATAQPYALLRDPAVAARLKPLLLGPVAIWSGTPDLGTTNVAQKSTLLLNLARWAAAQHATSGLEGLVALQDASDDVTQRYGWVNGISHVSVGGDSTFNVHDNVQVVTTTGTALLDNGLGLQLGYSNMASWGLVLPQNSGLGADATGGRTSQIVLASSASAGGGGAVAATITTDKQDYAPGETVTITGSGWGPGETVNFVLHEDPTLEADIKFSGVADAGGKTVSQSFTPDAQDLNVRFVLTATGATSGRVAQATFTDANAPDLIVTKSHSGNFLVGTNATYTITAANDGNAASSGTITVRDTLPTGMTFVSAAGASWSCSAAGSVVTCTTAQPLAKETSNTPSPATLITVTVSPTLAGTVTNRAWVSGGGETDGTNDVGPDPTTIRANTSTTITSDNPDPSVTGQSYAVAFAVTTSPAGAGTPTGSVTVSDGVANCTGALAGGSGSCSLTSTTAGAKTLTASYAASGVFNASSGTAAHTVNAAGTTTIVTSSNANTSFGQSVTFTAMIAVAAPGGGTPTGTVQFKLDGANFGAPATVSGGSATLTTSTIPVGSHTVDALYNGTNDFLASTGSLPGGQTVTKAASSVALASGTNPTVFGQSTTFTATVTAALGGGAGTGSVSFVDGGTCAAPGTTIGGPSTLNGAGMATLAIATLSVGTHNVFACYGGDANLSSGASATVAQVVNKAATTTALASSVNPSGFGQSITLTATVTITAPGAGTPTGNVTFKEGATTLGTGTLSGSSPFVATFATAALTPGSHTLTAVYAGDGSFVTSTSPNLNQTVNAAGTTTAVASSLNPSTFGQSVTFTASVISGTNPVTTGTIAFIEGGTCAAPGTTLQAAAAVNGSGQATFSTAALTGGSHTITGCYAPGTGFAASNGSVSQTVNAAATALTTQPASGAFGSTAALSATLTSGATPVSGKTITFKLNGTAAGSATTDATGVAAIAAANLGAINAGTYPAGVNSGVQADFATDGNLATATAGNTLTVTQQPTTLALTVPATASFGSSITLMAKLSVTSSGAMLGNQNISFTIGGTPVGMMATNNGGNANFTVILPNFPALVASTTPYTVTATFTASGNFAGSTDDASLTITKAPATLAFGTTTFTYDGSPKPVTVTTTPAGLTGVSITYAGSPTPPTNAGSYALVATLTNPNLAAPTINGTLLINKADQTIAFAALANKTFGDAPFTVSATATSNLAVTFAVGATDNCTISGASVTITGAGSCTVTASQAGDGNFNAAPSVPRSFTIAKASPQIAWNNPAPITFGAALGATELNAVVTGVGGLLLPGASVYTPAAGTLLNAGNGQSLSVLFTPTDAANYTTAAKNVTIDVLKFTPVASVTGTTATYDKNPHGATAFSVTGANGENLTGASTLSYAGTGSTTYGPSATAPTNGGTYDVTVSYPGSANYNPASAHDAIVINRATPSVAVTGGTFNYDKNAHPATGTVTGVGGDLLGPLTFSYNGSPSAPVNAGTYAVIGSYAGDQNYEPAVGNAQIVINPVAPTIVWATPAAITYGVALSGTQLNASATGVGGEAVSGAFAYSPAAGTVLHVAGSPHTLATAFTSSNPNYTDLAIGAPTNATVTLTVNPAPLTATAENKTKVYGSANPLFTATYAGFVNGDLPAIVTGSPNLTTTATAASGVAASPYAITWGSPIGVSAAPDYTITTADGQLSVTPAPLTVTADAKSKLYGGATPSFSATITGFVNSEALSSSGVTGSAGFAGAATTTTPLTGVGGYTITPTLGSLAAVNYAFTSFVDGALTINPAPLAVKADDKSREYGDDNPAFSAVITGFVNGENPVSAGVSGTASFGGTGGTSTHGTNVGNYPITPSAGTLVAANYTFDPTKGATYTDGTLTITRAPLLVKADPASKIFGDALPIFTGTLLTLKNNDPITASWIAGNGGTFTATTDAKSYPGAIAGVLSDPNHRLDNYQQTDAPATLTILPATPVFSTLSSPSVLFGTATTALSGTLSYVGTGATVAPAGGHVAITFHGTTQTVAVAADGSFSSTFASATVDVLGNPYPITYHFNNDESPDNFTAATDGAGALTIIDQTAPLTSNVLATPNPVAFGTSTQLTAQVSDAGRGSSTIDSAVATITGGNIVGSQTQKLTLGGGTFTRSAAATLSLPTGVYSVCITGTDAAKNVSAPECTLLAVYDASAGFVTGGGWINSPVGAYVPNPSLVGKANFGFVSKYQKGATIPTGDTEFQFQTAGLNFKSTSYDWLVISGTSKAQYKGTGTLNGVPGYGFILTAVDGKASGTGLDKFRIKITGPGGLVYDNQLNAPDTSDPSTALGGGSIVVHK